MKGQLIHIAKYMWIAFAFFICYYSSWSDFAANLDKLLTKMGLL